MNPLRWRDSKKRAQHERAVRHLITFVFAFAVTAIVLAGIWSATDAVIFPLYGPLQ